MGDRYLEVCILELSRFVSMVWNLNNSKHVGDNNKCMSGAAARTGDFIKIGELKIL